jgi:hypothetical protein
MKLRLFRKRVWISCSQTFIYEPLIRLTCIFLRMRTSFRGRLSGEPSGIGRSTSLSKTPNCFSEKPPPIDRPRGDRKKKKKRPFKWRPAPIPMTRHHADVLRVLLVVPLSCPVLLRARARPGPPPPPPASRPRLHRRRIPVGVPPQPTRRSWRTIASVASSFISSSGSRIPPKLPSYAKSA